MIIPWNSIANRRGLILIIFYLYTEFFESNIVSIFSSILTSLIICYFLALIIFTEKELENNFQ